MSISNHNMNDIEEANYSRDYCRKRKVAEETREARLAYDRNRKREKQRKVAQETQETLEQLEVRLVAEEENRTSLRRRRDTEGVSTSDQKLLSKFRNIISNLQNNLYEVPQELQGLTDIEEILIAQIFPVVSVYNLPGGQYAYRGNVINFPQDVQKFVTHLPRDPSSLDLLIVRRYTEDGSNFHNNILQNLPENGSIAEQLPQIPSDRIHHEEEGPSEQREDWIEDDEIPFTSQTFIPLLLTRHSEDGTINEILHRMQHDHSLREDWPHNENIPVDEFHTSGYMVRAFPTLYPWDSRFACLPRWRYFALNTIMRWRALSEGCIFVRQNLEEGQLIAAEILDLVETNNNIIDRMLHYGDGLRGTRQYWIHCRAELIDMLKQLGS
ncbi:hypothetical protein RhiirA5_437452 [Rhizophagus irregularis]|uniref:Uncharacterized protein n=1 Tax=Rhizophagus irregularis TaxID=588596 RepID=A0A2I1EI40_9GLOM|nr:hypothetical protein RhiirA5_437452 [Rhizophagus irregularis]PKY21795.1 hypothetical protein RhiirB3_435495 [Rhizophagus irregularis]